MTLIPPVLSPSAPADRQTALFEAAQNLESAFLAEMLQSAGFGQPSESFGGGAGEEQFGSFLVQEQAKHIVKGGGIGLAQSLFEALKEKSE
ncbi:rod-binding protein [Sulfitobacter sp. F26169L]|uniref:rod-binding protein n=1 Tax=Sulfitobacter sp. F26169L TaxID=2996015 RepID=UPI00226096F8|nr:rod-binding protein [Sulfitobacter sp. F26169L]MCX7565796.1 rod-binding protein [Sulfitobacter sp. F26169L]